MITLLRTCHKKHVFCLSCICRCLPRMSEFGDGSFSTWPTIRHNCLSHFLLLTVQVCFPHWIPVPQHDSASLLPPFTLIKRAGLTDSQVCKCIHLSIQLVNFTYACTNVVTAQSKIQDIPSPTEGSGTCFQLIPPTTSLCTGNYCPDIYYH